MLFRLQLPRRLYEEMLAHAQSAYPNECCGLLAGPLPGGLVTHHFPLLNRLSSPTEYESEGESHFRAHRQMRREELELLAIYHSHPTSEPVPSRKDIERNYYGAEVVHLI